MGGIGRRLALIAGGVGVAALLGAGSATAAPCHTLKSVIFSATPEGNLESGGRLSAAFSGVRPPEGVSHRGRALFQDREDWEQAWRAFTFALAPPQCPEGAPAGSEVFADIPLRLMAVLCEQTAPNGACARGSLLETLEVRFTFRAVEKGRWILWSAYPI